MRRLRRFTALALSLILALLAPGLPCYAAVGQSLEGSPVAGVHMPVMALGAVPRTFASNLSLIRASAFSAGLNSFSAAGNAPQVKVRESAASKAAQVAALTAQPIAANAAAAQAAVVPAAIGISPMAAPQVVGAVLAHSPFAPGFNNPSQAAAIQTFSSLKKLGSLVLDGAKAEFALSAHYEDVLKTASAQPIVVPAGLGSFTAARLFPGQSESSASQASREPQAPEVIPDPIKRAGIWGWIVAGAALAFAAAHSPMPLAQLIPSVLLYLGFAIPSFVLHEMGHAWMAKWLGDTTASDQGRLSWKLKDLGTHILPFWTIFLPLWTTILAGFAFGMANPVPVDSGRLWRAKTWVQGLMLVALAGPLVNLGLATLFGLLHAVVLGAGAQLIATALSAAVFVNVLLSLYNLLMPVLPADGHHVVRHAIVHWFRLPRLAQILDSAKGLQWLAFIGITWYFYPQIMALVQAVSSAILFVTGGFLFAPAAGVQLASAALPAIAAVGLFLGMVRQAPPARESVRVSEVPDPIHLIVRLPEGKKPLSEDMHLHWVDLSGPLGVKRHSQAQAQMRAQLEEGGLGPDLLSDHGATPLATYQKINMATLKVPAPRAADLRAALEARGFKVFANERIEIIKPIEPDPVQLQSVGGAVKMQEALRISGADKVHQIARKLWGPPLWEAGPLGRAALGLLRRIAQPPVAVLDSGADTSQKLLKWVKQVKNLTRAPNGDDIGHGTWVTGMLLFFAGWLTNVTHYKTFVKGGGSTDDILKALTKAAKDGNIILSNSWGSDHGDPESPESQLALALAKEGRIVVFAAGNNGQEGKDTIGQPAIMYFRDPTTKAPRILAIASTDREGRRSYFSSLGLGSPVTSQNKGQYDRWPHRPDAAGVGQDIEGPWPTYMKASRMDPILGPLKALSGSSMITPQFPGGLALLAMLFGVTAVGEELDKIVFAVMETLVNPHHQGEDAVGKGFYAFDKAYERAIELGLKPVVPAGLQALALSVLRRVL